MVRQIDMAAELFLTGFGWGMRSAPPPRAQLRCDGFDLAAQIAVCSTRHSAVEHPQPSRIQREGKA